jgi:hypothetical protein
VSLVPALRQRDQRRSTAVRTISVSATEAGWMTDHTASMSESLELSIVYEDGGDGWIVASIPQVPVRTARDARAKKPGQT